jgi:pyruvate dehydrogenase (quinone)
MAQTTSDLLVERLIDWGVDTVFGLPGDGINGFFEALRQAQDRVRFVHVRHEEEAAFAACGYAKFTGRLGVCCSTAGPGAVHLLNGLYDAKVDRAPVLAITGMPYHDLIGTDYVQDLNTDYLFQDVALVSQRVMGPSHVINLADKAIRAALTRRGVGHLAIPIDTQVAEAGADKRSKRNIKGHTSESYQAPFRVPVRSELEKAAQAFQGKHKVAILVGAGARGAGDEVEQAAEKLGAPVIKALLGKDVIPDDSPYTTGGAGLVGTRPSHMALKTCDALLIVGSSFPYIEFYPKPGQAASVQIDMDPERIGLRTSVDVGLVGDARATLRELLPLLPRNDYRSFLQQAQHAMQEWWELMEERSTRQTDPMRPQTVPWFLSEVLRDDAIICGDSGTVTNWIARQLRLRRGQNFSFSGTLCSMACGMSYALGAQVAYPGRQVVAVVGDGGFTMLPSAFITAVQEKLPIKVVVLKNNVLGLIKWEQMVYLGNPQYGVEMAPFDFVKFAEAAGGRGVRITDPARCRDQLAEALALDGPVVVEAIVDANEPPMPANVKPVQAAHLAEALVRGEPNRQRIGLTLFRDVVDETTFAAAPSGVVARVMEKAAKVAGNGKGDKEEQGGKH